MRDLDFVLINYPSSKSFFRKSKVHKGFFTGYLSVKDSIVSTLKEQSDFDTLYITGHSMGAAIAVFCAIDLAREEHIDKTKIKLYTFGCPETGNDQFIKIFKRHIKTSFRVVNDDDLIPKINIPGISHVPTLVLIDGKKLDINPNIITKIKETLEEPLAFLSGVAIQDHLSKHYVSALENAN